MPRIRSIKPEFWLDEDLNSLPVECHMFAAALLNHCDDEGFFKANDKLLNGQIFALRELSGSVTVFIQLLEEINYLRTFQGADGKRYGEVRNFKSHQCVNKPKPSKYKLLDPDRYQSGTTTGQVPLGKEQGTGNREHEKKSAKAAQCAQNVQHEQSFEAYFWETYPNKKDKKRAKSAWLKIKPDQALIDKIVLSLAAQISWRASAPPGAFIPQWKNPATWLNGENWNDVLEPHEVAHDKPVSGMAQNLDFALQHGQGVQQ